MTSTVHEGIRGNAGIVAKIDAIAYDGDIKKVEIEPTDKDSGDVTFAEAQNGQTKDYRLKITALISTEAGSFHRLLWDSQGEELAFVYGPHGNAIPTDDKPHYLMTIKVDGLPPLAQEASREKKRSEFTYEAEITSGPTPVRA